MDTCGLPSSSSSDSLERPDLVRWNQEGVPHDVELKEANCKYGKDGSVMVIPKGLKTYILYELADSMSNISPYPERHH